MHSDRAGAVAELQAQVVAAVAALAPLDLAHQQHLVELGAVLKLVDEHMQELSRVGGRRKTVLADLAARRRRGRGRSIATRRRGAGLIKSSATGGGPGRRSDLFRYPYVTVYVYQMVNGNYNRTECLIRSF